MRGIILHLLGGAAAAVIYWGGFYMQTAPAVGLVLTAMGVLSASVVLSFARQSADEGLRVVGKSANLAQTLYMMNEILQGMDADTAGALPVYLSDTEVRPISAVFLARINGGQAIIIDRAYEEDVVVEN